METIRPIRESDKSIREQGGAIGANKESEKMMSHGISKMEADAEKRNNNGMIAAPYSEIGNTGGTFNGNGGVGGGTLFSQVLSELEIGAGDDCLLELENEYYWNNNAEASRALNELSQVGHLMQQSEKKFAAVSQPQPLFEFYNNLNGFSSSANNLNLNGPNNVTGNGNTLRRHSHGSAGRSVELFPLFATEPEFRYTATENYPHENGNASYSRYSKDSYATDHQENHSSDNLFATKKICANCGSMSTPSWRRCPFGKQLLCNACGLYQKIHNKPRPFCILQDGSVKVQRTAVLDNNVCTNCKTTETPLWRRGLDGQALCNACGLYFKQHKSYRPVAIGKKQRRLSEMRSCSELKQPRRNTHDWSYQVKL